MNTHMYLFTGSTAVKTTWHGTPDSTRIGPSVAVVVLATDQAAAERATEALLSTPTDGGDRHLRIFSWTRVEHAQTAASHAVAGAALAEAGEQA